MQKINKTPIVVDININRMQPLSSGFYRVGFLTSHESVGEPFLVRKLDDLFEAGFDRADLAYNFCVSVFAENSMSEVVIYPKYPAESFESLANRVDLSLSYFLCLDTKDIDLILSFSDFLESNKYRNLLFFSHFEDYSVDVRGRKVVYYYDQFLSTETQPENIPYTYHYDKAYGFLNEGGSVPLEKDEAQTSYAAYPEASWISVCGVNFPSYVQWAFKELKRVRVCEWDSIPDLATTTAIYYGNSKATTDFAALANGVKIEHQVSLDWLESAIEYNFWQTLYQAERKVTLNRFGSDILETKLRDVLTAAVNEKILNDFEITGKSYNPLTATAAYTFTATLPYSILGVDKVTGSIYN